MAEPKYRIGLALSGGGAKGIAHLGVLQALDERGIKPNIIAGVSAGAIVAALYADGHSPRECCVFLHDSDYFQYISLGLRTGKGIMSNKRLHKLLGDFIKAKTFEELQIPIVVNATELIEGKNYYFERGPLIDKIVASSSFPIALTPTEIKGKIFVDGGILCNMPARIIRPRCQHLIGVHVNPIMTEGKINNIKNIADRVYHLMIQGNTITEKAVCDLMIEPVKARNFGMFDKSKAKQLFKIGYEAAQEVFKNHPEFIKML